MKTSEQIIQDTKRNVNIEDYSLLEMHLYLCIEQILKMFSNKQITKDEANRRKTLAVKKYEDLKKEYEFELSMFQEHIANIKETEDLRRNLIKLLNEKEIITEERLAKCLNLSLNILSYCFKGEFEHE